MLRKTSPGFRLLAVCTLLIYGSVAYAIDYTLHGYGTLGIVDAGLDTADFVRSTRQPAGAGSTHRWGTNVDSRIGLQLNAQMTDKLSAVVQILSEYNYEGSYKPSLEWANLKYMFTPALSVRIGRTVTSHFLASDRRLVGYTYPWARPPQELYGLIPVTSMDGIDASYEFPIGQAAATLGASLGQRDLGWRLGGKARGRNIFNLNGALETASTTFRVDYSTLRVSYIDPDLELLMAGIGQFAAVASSFPGGSALSSEITAIADRYSLTNKRSSLISIGINYDRDNLLLMTEWGRFHITGQDVLSAYDVTAGYRFGPVMPYLLFSGLYANESPVSALPTTGLPPSLVTTAATLSNGLRAFVVDYDAEQRTVAVGVRIELPLSTDIKFQYDRVRPSSGSHGRFVNVSPQFKPGDVGIFSVVLDIVF